MHLTRAYRSLPRPSSKFKPSYPPNSLICLYLIKSFTLYFYRVSLVIFYTVLIEYNTCRQVILKLPKPTSLNSVHHRFRKTRKFFLNEAASPLLLPKKGMNIISLRNGPAVSRTRTSSVQARYSATRLQALHWHQSLSRTRHIMRPMTILIA